MFWGEFIFGAIVGMFVRGKLTLTSKNFTKKKCFQKYFKKNFCWIPVVLRIVYIKFTKKAYEYSKKELNTYI